MIKKNIITGSGGGGKGGGGGGGGVEAPNTLVSKATIKVLDIISEGDIVGLATGDAKSIYFNETPVQNADDTYNFGGLEWDEKVGEPAGVQTPVHNITDIENVVVVNTAVKEADGGIIRAITDTEVDAGKVTLRFSAGLSKVDTASGDIDPNNVIIAIDTRPVSGSGVWTEQRKDKIKGKSTSAYERQYRIEKPAASTGAWDIRVRRVSSDSEKATDVNSFIWSALSEIKDLKLSYPDTAVIGVDIDAQLLGNSVPARGYKVFGRIIQIPNNYTPRAYDPDGTISAEPIYSGIWGGTFTTGWTNNPAWILYDILTHERYGLGVDAANIDKFGLYTIAIYCDTLVDDGIGGSEPRFTFNGVINTRQEAYHIIQALLSNFRAMGFWSSDSIIAAQDSPSDVVKLVTPSNVLDGIIDYPRAAQKSKHSVAVVTWNDPEDFYKPNIEIVEDSDLIVKLGYKQMDALAVGCTSQGQARRLGKWILDTEKFQTTTAIYRASFDHAQLYPGDNIAIADPIHAGVRFGGRVKSATINSIEIDDPDGVVLAVAETYEIQFVKDDSTLNALVSITDAAGTYTTVNVSPDFDEIPAVGAVWQINGTDVEQRLFKVISNKEISINEFEITALLHDPDKYDRVETGLVTEPAQTTRYNEKAISPITGLTAEVEIHTLPEKLVWRLNVDWIAPAIGFAQSYVIHYRRNDGDVKVVGEFSGTSGVIDDILPGEYVIYVIANGFNNIQSLPTYIYLTVSDDILTGIGKVTGLQIERQGNNTEYSGRDIILNWRYNTPQSSYALGERYGADGGFMDDSFKDYQIEIYTTADVLLRTEYVNNNTFTYTYEMNLTDGGARRDIKFKVRWRAKTGQMNQGQFLTATNSPPVVPDITIDVSHNTVTLIHDRSIDPDYSHTSVWMSTTPSFTPTNQELISSTTDSRITVSALEAETTYYFRVMLHDIFDPESGTLSEELTATTTDAPTTVVRTKWSSIDTSSDPSKLLKNIPNGFRPLDCKIYVKKAWNAPATLSVGYNGGQIDGIMKSTEVDLTTAGFYKSDATIFNSLGGAATAFLDNNGSTKGKAWIFLTYITAE